MKKMFTFTKNVAWLCEMASAWKQSLKFVDHQLDVASFFLLDAATSDTVSRSFEQRKWIWSSLNFRSRDTWERESFMVILPRRWSRVSDRFFLNTLCDCRIESEWGEDDDVEPLGNLDLDYANGHPGAEEKSSPSINPPSSPTLVGVRFLTSSNTRTHWFKKCVFIFIFFKLLKKKKFLLYLGVSACVTCQRSYIEYLKKS